MLLYQQSLACRTEALQATAKDLSICFLLKLTLMMENPCDGCCSTAIHDCPFHRGWEQPVLMDSSSREAQMVQTFKKLTAEFKFLPENSGVYLNENL